MTRNDLSRRRFISSAGVTITLPLLPSLMYSRKAGAQAACAPVKRLVTYSFPNGHKLDEHVPTVAGSGTAWALPPMLVPMQSLKSDLLFVSGLENQQRRRELGDHSIGSGSLFTARKPTKMQQITNSSVDQIVADAVGACTAIPSLQLGTHNIAGADQFGTYYTRNISWRGLSMQNSDGTMTYPQGAATPLGKEIDPQAAFDNIFQGTDPTTSAADAAMRRSLKKSVLDAVVPHGSELDNLLNAADRIKVDELFTGIRALEDELAKTPSTTTCVQPARPAANLAFQSGQLDTMHSLMAIAFQCDITRVISFMMGDAQNQRDLSFIPDIAAIGGEATDHTISHHMNMGTRLQKFRAAVLWKQTQIASFLTKLKTMTDSDGQSLLANSLVLISSDLSDGNLHNHDNYPMLVAGQLGGLVTTDRHVAYPVLTDYTMQKTFGDFYIKLLSLYGVTVTTYGDDGKEALAWNQ
jgi:hypothetical protein